MSQENVELVRASIEANARLVASEGFDQEVAISKMAELWDPEIELDASESEVPGLVGSTGGSRPFNSSGESGMAPGTPSTSSTSWSMPGTA